MPRRGCKRKRSVQCGAEAEGAPPGPTGLAKRNDGVFPARAVNEIIDGTALLAAHGTRELPIWGFDVMVRSRIMAIVDYLKRIQEK